MLRILLLSLITINLFGCSTAVKVLAHHFDSNDPCQEYGKPDAGKGWRQPNYCGSPSSPVGIYNARGERVGFIR